LVPSLQRARLIRKSAFTSSRKSSEDRANVTSGCPFTTFNKTKQFKISNLSPAKATVSAWRLRAQMGTLKFLWLKISSNWRSGDLSSHFQSTSLDLAVCLGVKI
jgi:hypothetical protein